MIFAGEDEAIINIVTELQAIDNVKLRQSSRVKVHFVRLTL